MSIRAVSVNGTFLTKFDGVRNAKDRLCLQPSHDAGFPKQRDEFTNPPVLLVDCFAANVAAGPAFHDRSIFVDQLERDIGCCLGILYGGHAPIVEVAQAMDIPGRIPP